MVSTSLFSIDLEVHQSSSCSCIVNIMHLCVITFIYLLAWDLFASLLIRNFHNSFAVLASSEILLFIERRNASHFHFCLVSLLSLSCQLESIRIARCSIIQYQWAHYTKDFGVKRFINYIRKIFPLRLMLIKQDTEP